MQGSNGASVPDQALVPSGPEPKVSAHSGNDLSRDLSHDEAIRSLCDCAATVTVLSYQEAIEGYFTLRGMAIPK